MTLSSRWAVAASHCADDFPAKEERRQVRTVVIRDNTRYKEVVEVKKVYKHPNYQYPALYDDIAVLELGRRIVYDHERVSPFLSRNI